MRLTNRPHRYYRGRQNFRQVAYTKIVLSFKIMTDQLTCGSSRMAQKMLLRWFCTSTSTDDMLRRGAGDITNSTEPLQGQTSRPPPFPNFDSDSYHECELDDGRLCTFTLCLYEVH